eukprot:CAMPEP_0201510932 /NCGR_PEP_ID=MMETSP0161_2-20130828/3457_1 /ASSEMBLY_ACC=CAM_ASM_000251 /TAXON_ID=180227 /ORGANISM="Neoparamoeba aestuarina, Strain SoJaBio B1-5/56/2" /LENGTH=295 /DNA_ID=CAMNT_0047906211 /DNA_START=247 /DNA_END=1134 /DNA_ORIENTATION=+
MTSLICLTACVVAVIILISPKEVSAANAHALKDPPPPEMYAVVECTTSVDTTQPIVIEVYSNWAPKGAERFVDLVEAGYYDKSPIFRVAKRGRGWGFVTQFGISLDKDLDDAWKDSPIQDDPQLGFSWDRGDVSMAADRPNSRTTQVVVSYSDTTTRHLGTKPWETPFGKVIVGMNIADEFYDGGEFRQSMESPPQGQGPDPKLIRSRGKTYLTEKFPKLTYIERCTVAEDFRDKKSASFQKKGLPVFQVGADNSNIFDKRQQSRDERRKKIQARRDERVERARKSLKGLSRDRD